MYNVDWELDTPEHVISMYNIKLQEIEDLLAKVRAEIWKRCLERKSDCRVIFKGLDVVADELAGLFGFSR